MKYIVVLFCLVSSLSYGQKGRKHVKTSNPSVVQNIQSEGLSDADQILQLVLSEFTTKLDATGSKPSKIIILDNKPQLVNKNLVINEVNFVSGGKPEIINNNGISVSFWRVDISETKAHIEFYYTDSRNLTQREEYILTKENAVWRK